MATVSEGPLPYNLWEQQEKTLNPTDAVIFVGISLLIGVSCRSLLRPTTYVPYTVVLLLLGTALGSLEFGSNYPLGKLGNGIRIWADIDADLLLAVFLPILIFEGSFSMEVHQIKKCMAQMLLLAGPGVLVSTVLIGSAVKLVFPYDWSWRTSFLLGAILSATDPVAVVALLKDLGTSKKLSTIVEGESMMNDGAAIVVYQLFYRMVLGKSFGWVAVLEYLAQGSLGAVIIGLVFGMASLFWLRFIFNDTVIDFSLALTVSYIAYYTAQAAEASGILTLVALGMVFAMSKDAFKAGGKQSLHEFWYEIMLNYAKHQLFRKAEEFSRLCSNPFDWITVGAYATSIKDVCQDTVWPPCMTINSSYLEIDDMKTMRVCFLKATREAYWSTFSEGRITESTINVLIGSVDEAIDLAIQGLHDWNYISTCIKFPDYYKFFSASVCPQRLTRFFVLKKLQNSCHVCSAFIHAHRVARQVLLDYTGDNGIAATVFAESEAEEVEAQKFLEDVKTSMPEIIHQTESRQVTFSMLKCLDERLNDMEKDGILSDRVVMHVHDSLQNDFEKLSRSPPSVRIPKPRDVIRFHPLLGNLSPAIQSDLEHSAKSILKTPGCTLYKKGSKLKSVWLIENGSVRSKRSPFPIDCALDSTYHRGCILGLYEALVRKPYLCDMVTDSVALCVEIKLESVISVLGCANGVDEFLWKESTIAISKLLMPDIFEKFSMQELRGIIDERSAMNTFSSQETIETSHHSINILLSGCLRDQSIGQLIECPAILPCSILKESIPNTNVMDKSSGSYSKYKVVEPARIIRIDISE